MAGTTLNPLYKANARPYTLNFTDEDGLAISIVDWKLYFTLKKYAWKLDADASIVKDITEHSDPTHGITTFTLTKSDTEELRSGVYVFDIQIKKADGTIVTLLVGTLELKTRVTRRTD